MVCPRAVAIVACALNWRFCASRAGRARRDHQQTAGARQEEVATTVSSNVERARLSKEVL